MGKETLVLFDVGGVLLKLDFGKYYTEAEKLTSVEGFQKRYHDSRIELKLMNGELKTEDFLKELRNMLSPKKEISDDELKELFSLRLGMQIKEMTLLKARIVNAGYSVGIFSNVSKLSADIIRKKFPGVYDTYGGPQILSYNLMSVKPEPQMYNEVKGFKNVILIDDNESNVKVAVEDFRWKGIFLKGYIDNKEAIRAINNRKEHPKGEFRIANDSIEAEKALAEFGVTL